MFWVISFDFCIGRAPHSSHADSCILRGLVVCVIWSVMLVRYGCLRLYLYCIYIPHRAILKNLSTFKPFLKVSAHSDHFLISQHIRIYICQYTFVSPACTQSKLMLFQKHLHTTCNMLQASCDRRSAARYTWSCHG